MSNPSDIYIKFATRGIDRVLSDMKRIEKGAEDSAKKSAAVEQALSQTTEGKRRKAAAKAVEIAQATSNAVVTAERAGHGKIATELRKALDKRRAALADLAKSVAADQSKFASIELSRKRQLDAAFHKDVDKRRGAMTALSKDVAEHQQRSSASETKAQTKITNDFNKAIDKRRNAVAQLAKDVATHQSKAPQPSKASEELNKAIDKRRGHTASLAKDVAAHQDKAAVGQSKLADEHGKDIDKRRGDIARLAKDVASQQEKTAAAERSIESRAEAERNKAIDKRRGAAARLAKDVATHQERGITAASKASERAEKKEQNQHKQRMARAAAEQVSQFRERANRRDQRIERFVLRPIANGLQGAVSNVAGHVVSTAQKAAGLLLNAGGGFSADQSVSERLNFESQSALVANKFTGATTKEVMDDAKALSTSSGYDRGEIVRTRGKYLDLAGPRDMDEFKESNEDTKFFLKIAKASGANPEDVASAGGLLKLQNRSLKSPEMRDLLLSTWDQGKRGGIDFDKMSTALPNITKTANSYAGDWSTNVRHLLGSSQVLRGSGSVAEAATSLSNVPMNIKFHKDEVNDYFTKGGKKGVFDSNERLTVPVDELLAQIMEMSGGKESEVMKMGSGHGVIGMRAIKAFEGDAGRVFYDAKDKHLAAHKGDEKGANKAGADAFRETFKTAIGSFDKGKLEGDLNKDYDNVMKTSAEKFEAAVRSLKEEVGDQLVPVLEQLVPMLKDFIPALSEFIKFIGEYLGAEGRDLSAKLPKPGEKAEAIAAGIKTPQQLEEKQKQIAELEERMRDPRLGINAQQSMGNVLALAKDSITPWALPVNALSDHPDKDSYFGRTQAQEAELRAKQTELKAAYDELIKGTQIAAAAMKAAGSNASGGKADPGNRSPAAPGTPRRAD